MMQEKKFTDLALAFPGTVQQPHFNRTGYKIMGKKMFATYLATNNTANIFLSREEQFIFCTMHSGIYPVANKWGEKGATTFDLNQVPESIVHEALLSAYQAVISPKK